MWYGKMSQTHFLSEIVSYEVVIACNQINKKCHSHVTNAPKGIGLAQDTFVES